MADDPYEDGAPDNLDRSVERSVEGAELTLDDYFKVLARKAGVDEGEAVKRAMAFYLWYLDLRDQGGTIYVRLPDGTFGEPIFNLTDGPGERSQGTL